MNANVYCQINSRMEIAAADATFQMEYERGIFYRLLNSGRRHQKGFTWKKRKVFWNFQVTSSSVVDVGYCSGAAQITFISVNRLTWVTLTCLNKTLPCLYFGSFVG